jgi:hypothetical protein
MTRRPTIAVLLVLVASGCQTKAPTVSEKGIEEFGLIEAPVDHPALLSSIRIARLVMGSSASVKVAAGWQAGADASSVRVFAATADGFADDEIMRSDGACHCVVAQVGAVTRWLKLHTGQGEELLDMDTHDLLAYMLLHEIGHIVHGDSPEGVEPGATQNHKAGFNFEATVQKNREVAADRYAAGLIAAAMADRGTDRGIAATKIALTLSQLSWNLAGHRLLDNFGGTGLHQPVLFRDAGLSHPNLEWRILSVNDAISSTEASHKLLTDFESARGAAPVVLFRAPTP